MDTTAPTTRLRPAATRTHSGEPFFFYHATVMCAVVFLGFGANFVVNWEELDRFTIPIALHALFNGGWFLLLVSQPWLIRHGNPRLHRQFGLASVVLALALVLAGVIMTLDLFHFIVAGDEFDAASAADRVDAAGLLWGTGMQWVAFVGLYVAAIVLRRHGPAHKRLMLFTGIVMSFAGTSRLLEIFGFPGFASLPAAALMIAAIFVHDWRTGRRIHAAAVGGTAVFLGMVTSFFLFGQSEWWVGVVDQVLGFGPGAAAPGQP